MTLSETVKKAGVVGAGGAGFPAHVKLGADVDTLIVNGAECEPLLAKDRAILERRAADVGAGILAIRDELGAKRAVLAVKEKVAGEVAKALPGIEVHALPDVYPAGDEVVLVNLVTGARVPAGGIPPDVGILVSNVETVLNVARATRSIPVTTKWVTVAGAVRTPATYEVPIGTPFSYLLETAGVQEGRVTVFEGGPAMGAPVDPDRAAVSLTTGCILVLPKNHKISVLAEMPLEHVRTIAGTACTQCRDCTEMCPRYLQGHDVQPHLSMRRFFRYGVDGAAEEFANAAGCTECGLCELYACPMDITPRRVQAAVRASLNGTRPRDGLGAVHPDIVGRMVPATRFRSRADLGSYEKPAPYAELGRPVPAVRIPLEQAYGGRVKPIVEVGDRVEVGQVIAEADEERTVPVHASIAGTAGAVVEGHIEIIGE
jgi:Na+-translocating ferredoxin:NAD+ oxidoreductase RnfC subunit